MFLKNKDRFANMGKVKKSTEGIVNDAVAKQGKVASQWRKNRPVTPAVASKRFEWEDAKPEKKKSEAKPAAAADAAQSAPGPQGILAYWFPILCAAVIVALIFWIFLTPNGEPDEAAPAAPSASEALYAPPTVSPVVAEPAPTGAGIPEPTVRVINETVLPEFDIVRIGNDGRIIIAGRYLPRQGVSVIINGKIVATESADESGYFTYTPSKEMAPGNYIIKLSAASRDETSENDVFVMVAEKDYGKSLSLLMTKDGSRLLQAPAGAEGDLAVSKIDYLENGRLVVQGTAVPRLRVSLSLDGKYIGFARTSDHKTFGLGASVEKLEAGKEYELAVRMHDGEGNAVAAIEHRFVMPAMTPGDETFYTVRRGDALWIISRNFLGRGALFTLIVEKNDVKNPNLIYPKQVLKIPVNKTK